MALPGSTLCEHPSQRQAVKALKDMLLPYVLPILTIPIPKDHLISALFALALAHPPVGPSPSPADAHKLFPGPGQRSSGAGRALNIIFCTAVHNLTGQHVHEVFPTHTTIQAQRCSHFHSGTRASDKPGDGI